jgi:DNA (cytosine-5)-methyltransferase 1
VLDAQNFGVAQRRRRVFVVGHLGDWKPAAEVLFESESLSGNITQSRKERQDIANCLTKSPSSYSSYNPARGEGNAVITHCVDTFPTLLSSTAGVSRPGNAVTEHQTYIAYALQGAGATSQGGNGSCFKKEQSYTLNVTDVHGIVKNMAVRRLTPVECERLQGFPDNYTNIPKAADTNRYKALGNSMAVPVMRWIGERINQYEQRGVA